MKDERIYEDFEIEFTLTGKSRDELRRKTVEKFLSEKRGFWKNGVQHVTRYKYFVERLSDGRRVYLLRPTFLNKGIDFQVWVEKMEGEKDKKPSHEDVFNDLIVKRKENPEKIPLVIKAIHKVWECQEPDDVIGDLGNEFKEGFPLELLLKILKWLFIEQDITYWNYDGRSKLRMAIDEKLMQQKLS